MPVRAPRDLSALPFAHHLEPAAGPVEREEIYENLHFVEQTFEDTDGSMSRFTESAFSTVVFEGGRYRRSRFDDVWMHGVRIVGADLVDTSWLDVECVAGVLAGLQVHGSVVQRTVFHQCKLDSVNLRAARLRDVVFADCLLRDVDFGGASLTQVSFPGSTLDGVHFAQATLAKVDLRGAVALGIASGVDALRGATVTPLQMLDLAPALAAAVGLAVEDA